MTDPRARARGRAHDRLRPRLARAEEPDHPRAQEPQPRRRLPGRRHQRRALAPRGRRRHLRRDAPSTWPRTRPTSSCSSASLDVLHAGILEGRRAFGNVMKYLLMGTSSNFGNMFSMAGAFALPAVPADAADADPAQQLPLRSRPDHDPHRQRRRRIHPQARSAGTSGSSATSCWSSGRSARSTTS